MPHAFKVRFYNCRHPDPYLGSWRDSLYQLPHPLHHPLQAHHHHARGHPPGHHRPEFTKRQAPLPPLINKDRKPRRKTEDSFVMASAYKAFNQVWNCWWSTKNIDNDNKILARSVHHTRHTSVMCWCVDDERCWLEMAGWVDIFSAWKVSEGSSSFIRKCGEA